MREVTVHCGCNSKYRHSRLLFPFTSDNRDDQLPRACAIAFLSRLDPINELHQRLMEELVTLLLKKVRNGKNRT